MLSYLCCIEKKQVFLPPALPFSAGNECAESRVAVLPGGVPGLRTRGRRPLAEPPCWPRPRAVQKSGVPGPTHTRRVRTCAPVQAARRPSRTSTPEKLRSAEPAVSGVSLQSSLLKDSVINGFVTVTFPRLNISTCN